MTCITLNPSAATRGTPRAYTQPATMPTTTVAMTMATSRTRFSIVRSVFRNKSVKTRPTRFTCASVHRLAAPRPGRSSAARQEAHGLFPTFRSRSSATPIGELGPPEDFPRRLTFPHRAQAVIDPATSVVVSQPCPPRSAHATRPSFICIDDAPFMPVKQPRRAASRASSYRALLRDGVIPHRRGTVSPCLWRLRIPCVFVSRVRAASAPSADGASSAGYAHPCDRCYDRRRTVSRRRVPRLHCLPEVLASRRCAAPCRNVNNQPCPGRNRSRLGPAFGNDATVLHQQSSSDTSAVCHTPRPT